MHKWTNNDKVNAAVYDYSIVIVECILPVVIISNVLPVEGVLAYALLSLVQFSNYDLVI